MAPYGAGMRWETGDLVQLVVLVLTLAVALGLAVALRRSRRHQRAADPPPAPAPKDDAAAPARELPRLGVVVNPTKLADADERRRWLTRACEQAGWGEPLWLETSVEDPGTGQALRAVARGASTVLAWGGDGTVRAVAAGLAGTDVPLALLASGTGNLLARNLGLPLSNPDAAVSIALADRARLIDVARAEIDVSGEDEDPRRETYLVMAGLGFDAEVMAAVAPRLKERVGWMAYVVAGAQHLRGHDARVTIRLDGGPVLRRRVRSVVVGNCGELTGGVRLLPDARPDDGWLDLVVVSPRGVVGWAAVTMTVLTRHRRGHPVVEHFRCRSVEIRPERALPAQLDGDPIGSARALRVRVDEGVLAIKSRTAGRLSQPTRDRP